MSEIHVPPPTLTDCAHFKTPYKSAEELQANVLALIAAVHVKNRRLPPLWGQCMLATGGGRRGTAAL